MKEKKKKKKKESAGGGQDEEGVRKGRERREGVKGREPAGDARGKFNVIGNPLKNDGEPAAG